MAYWNPSDFSSPEPASAWWKITANSSGNQVNLICSSTGYEIASLIRNWLNDIIRRNPNVRDWSGNRLRPLSGPVSFDENMQRSMWALTSNRERAAKIKMEADYGAFSYHSMEFVLTSIMRIGAYTANVPPSIPVTVNQLSESGVLIPSNWIEPMRGAPLPQPAGTREAVCIYIAEETPAVGQPPVQQVQEQVQATPSDPIYPTPLPQTEEDYGLITPLPPQGSFDASGTYVPTQAEAPQYFQELVPMPGNLIRSEASLPPPPASINFLSRSESDSTTMVLGIAAIAALAFVAMSSSGAPASDAVKSPEAAPARATTRRARRAR